MNFFGKLAEQATDFIEKNPDQVKNFQQQAAGFLKTAVDKEVEKEAQKTSSGQPLSGVDRVKAQALGALQPQLDQFVTSNDGSNDEGANDEGANDEGANDDTAAAETETETEESPSKPPPGKPSYLVSKKDDESPSPAAEEEPPAPAPPKKRPPGMPSYLIGKKNDPEDDE